MEYEKEHIITFISKDPDLDGEEMMEVYRDSEWDACISRYRELEAKNYTVMLKLCEITTSPVLSHTERHIHV